MEHIRTRPMVLLALLIAMIGVIALSQLVAGQRGPVCAEMPMAQPGFAALSRGPAPACIRIRLP